MKYFAMYMTALVLIFAASITHARDNKDLCKEWCDQERSCKRCSSLSHCGQGLSPIATFKGTGKNYFACAENVYGKSSDRNRDACKDFCDENTQCTHCSASVGCGTGHTKLMSFGGSGKNWFACKKTVYGRAGEKHKKACNKWCDDNELCIKCSTKKECGSGLTSMKHFTGSGMNWHACRKTGSASNKAACKQWCDAKSKCVKCSKKPGCGMGQKSMKMFKGPGKNWFACEKR